MHTCHNLSKQIQENVAEPNSSVDSIADLRTGGSWFDPRVGQYIFRGLMIVIAKRFLSYHCPLFQQWLCRKAASGLEAGFKRTPGKHE